jgi:hypothetical protein
VILLVACAFAAWGVYRRIGRVGRFTLDRGTREIVRVDGGRERRWAFAQVTSVALREDGFDASRPDLLPGGPCWLEVGLVDGTVLRIAKGSEVELKPVLQTLQAWEIGPRS